VTVQYLYCYLSTERQALVDGRRLRPAGDEKNYVLQYNARDVHRHYVNTDDDGQGIPRSLRCICDFIGQRACGG
ncbi:MAG: hypothetical protein ACRERD_01985, partial [Candidatus Binatia bacterium]